MQPLTKFIQNCRHTCQISDFKLSLSPETLLEENNLINSALKPIWLHYKEFYKKQKQNLKIEAYVQ